MIAENLSSKQYMLKYGTNIEVGHVYKNFLEVLEAVGLPVELSQSKSSKSRIIESLKEHTIYRRSGQKWVFQENNYGKIKEFPELEEGEILLPYDDQEVYYVSSFGRIWNRKNREWISKYEYRGRYKVSLYSRSHILSRVVAITFIPNPDNKPEVNHKDENPQNNRVDNLEWVTRKENLNRACNDLIKIQENEESKINKQSDFIIYANKAKFNSFDDAAKWIAKKNGMKENTNLDMVKKSILSSIRTQKKYCNINWQMSFKK